MNYTSRHFFCIADPISTHIVLVLFVLVLFFFFIPAVVPVPLLLLLPLPLPPLLFLFFFFFLFFFYLVLLLFFSNTVSHVTKSYLLGADLLSDHYKSGGTDYIAEDNSFRVALHLNSTTRRNLGFAVPCLAMDKVSPELKPFCGAYLDPDRPGWYAVHRDGVLYYEPEYAPRNPDTFDEDSSFISKEDNFFPGFITFEPFSLPNHYIVAGPDGAFLRVAEFQNTPEFKDAASIHVIGHHTKGETANVCLACLSVPLLLMTWQKQCIAVVLKANRITLGMIKRNFVNETPEIILALCKSLVRPHLEYCSPRCGILTLGLLRTEIVRSPKTCHQIDAGHRAQELIRKTAVFKVNYIG